MVVLALGGGGGEVNLDDRILGTKHHMRACNTHAQTPTQIHAQNTIKDTYAQLLSFKIPPISNKASQLVSD